MSKLYKPLLVTSVLLFFIVTPATTAQTGWDVNTQDWIFSDGSVPTPTPTIEPTITPNPEDPTPTPEAPNQPTQQPGTTIPTPQATLPPTYPFPITNILIVGLAGAVFAFVFLVAKTRNQNHENN